MTFNGGSLLPSRRSSPSSCECPQSHRYKSLTARLACMWIWRLPESPRWLVGQGRHVEAIAVLAALDDKPVDHPEVLDTWKGIVDSASQSEGDFAFGELFHHGRVQHFRRTCLGVLVQCVLSFSSRKAANNADVSSKSQDVISSLTTSHPSSMTWVWAQRCHESSQVSTEHVISLHRESSQAISLTSVLLPFSLSSVSVVDL